MSGGVIPGISCGQGWVQGRRLGRSDPLKPAKVTFLP